MADLDMCNEMDDNHKEYHLHGCKCLDGDASGSQCSRPHFHCPCDVCNGKAVSLMTGWRHREINKKLGIDQTFNDSVDEVHVASGALPEFDNAEMTAASFSASYSELQTSQHGNLADADPLLLGDDILSEDDAVEEGIGDDQDEMESCCLDADSRDMPSDEEDMQRFIHEAVLKLVELKGENGFSIKAFEELLRWGKGLHCHTNPDSRQNWPTTWEEVKAFLENIGYKDAKLYWICLDASHPCNYGLMESKEEPCKHCGRLGNIPYYYLSLFYKVANWCSSPVMCKKMTAHWEQKDHWLPAECKNGWGFPEKREIWDGKRFAELSYFWDPSQEWTLPIFCPVRDCQKVISAEELLQAPENDGRREVTCPSCFNSYSVKIETAHGDPRNIAYIAHWDGWQPFSTSVRGCGAIEVSIATMSKVERCHTEEVYVTGFVPSYLLPKKRPISLDPFIEPLIREIEEGFILGMQVNFCIPVCGCAAGDAVIRHLILCWAGDHNGQCEVGKFIKCGKSGCRRCKTTSIYIPEANHYYYPGFRQQTRFPAEEKSVVASFDKLCEIEEEERITVRQKKARESGYTGLSILHRLHALYGFEYDRHLVYDELHGISLNTVKNHIAFLKANEDEPIDWKEVDSQLRKVPWTHEFRASRTPQGIHTRSGFWKAEDYNKFAFPASEVALVSLLSQSQTEEWLCLCRIVEFLQNHARNKWSENDADTFHRMAIRYAVLLEEHHGPTSCHITLHNLLHFRDDIRNFSGLDNYSCWVQERAVQRYIHQSNNHKNIEFTFAAAELRREVLKAENEIKFVRQNITDKVDIDKGWAKSLEQAKMLNKTNIAIQQKTYHGILVGGQHSLLLGHSDCQKIADVSDVDVSDVSGDAFSCRSVWKSSHGYDGLLYREQEFIVIVREGQGEVVAHVRHIFATRVADVYTSYLDVQIMEGVGFNPCGLPLVKRSDEVILTQLSNLSRKVMLFPSTEDENGQQIYTVIDYMRRIFPVQASTVVVPYYPVNDDMVNVKGDDGEVWKARVIGFNMRRQVIQGRFFVQRHDNLWFPEGTRPQAILFNSILGIASGDWMDGSFNCWKST